MNIYEERFKNYKAAREAATFTGPGHETREERSERLFREHTENLLIESAERMTLAELDAIKEDRAYREAHPTHPSPDAMEHARAYIASVDAMIARGEL